MTLVGNDFSLPEGEGEGEPASEARTAPPAMIVIENRHGGLGSRLMPAALVLLAAIVISSFQRKTPVWPLIPRPQPQPVANPPAVAIAPTPTPETGPKEAETHPADPTPGAVSPTPGNPEPVRKPSPFDLDSENGLHPLESPGSSPPENSAQNDPPVVPPPPIRERTESPFDGPPEGTPFPPANDNAMTPPQEAAEPSKDEILRDIEREAEQKDANRQDLEGLKSNAQRLLLNEALSKVDTERNPFHEELKALLARLGEGAGKEIEKLSDRYSKEPMPQVKRAYAQLLRTAPRRWSRQAKVGAMRAVGVPEPLILDQICHDFDKLINTRGGPRSEDEVRVRAARALLAIPLPPAPRNPAAP